MPYSYDDIHTDTGTDDDGMRIMTPERQKNNTFNVAFMDFSQISNNKVYSINIKSVDGIELCANIDNNNVSNNVIHLVNEFMRFSFTCDWKNHQLYEYYCHSPLELKEFITEILPKLKYSNITNQFSLDEFRGGINNMMMNYLPKNENIVRLVEECCVCFEIVKTNTSCGHPLCYKCETKIKNKICPLCRTNYKHCELNKDDE